MSQVDLVILFLAVALPLLWWFRESLPFIGGKPASAADASLKRGGAGADDEGDPRDFVGKMERGVSILSCRIRLFPVVAGCQAARRAEQQTLGGGREAVRELPALPAIPA